MRKLSPDEAELWAKVTATIRPLSRARASAVVTEDPVPQSPSRPSAIIKVKGRVPSIRPPAAAVAKRKIVGPGGLDGSWDRRLKSGSVIPDRTLDLHGHNLDGAWSAIDHGIEAAIAAGDRVVLLITGHARPGAPPIERGKIRAAVHDWLAHSRHADRIASVRGAHRRHGGGGSLYLILRR
ncbi:MAG: Smr/MutS family protein [Sphingomicrobium sp.]